MPARLILIIILVCRHVLYTSVGGNFVKMKRTLTTLLFLFLLTSLFGQVVPICDSTQRIKNLGLKSITVKFKSITDYKKYNGFEIVKIKYNQAGKKVYEKYLRLFDVVDYAEEFFYKYGSNGLLTEKIKVQKDPEGITTTKWIYTYNIRGLIDKEFEYLKKEDSEPNLQTIYEYDPNDRLVKETRKHLRAPEQNSYLNMSYEYFYNNNGLIKEIKESWTNSNYVVVEKYEYKELAIVGKRREYNGHIQKQTDYEYNEQGKLIKESILNNMIDDEETIEYSYNEKGLLTRKRDSHKNGIKSKYEYSYSDNGELSEEFWFSERGTKAFSFVTSYEK